MRVPHRRIARLFGPAIPVDLHERHARLDQSPRQQDALAEWTAAIAIAHWGRLALEVEGVPGARRAQHVERLLGLPIVAIEIAIRAVDTAIDCMQEATAFVEPP